MGRYCMVPGCKSGGNYIKTPGVIIHCLPEDDPRAEAWLQKINRSGKVNWKNTGVCSLHFVASDYEEDMRFRLLHPGCDPMTNRKRKLKPDALPSQNLSKDINHRVRSRTVGQRQEASEVASGPTTERDKLEEHRKRSQERQESRNRRELVERLLAEHEERELAAAVLADVRAEANRLSRTRTTDKEHGSLTTDPILRRDSVDQIVSETDIGTGQSSPGGASPASPVAESLDSRPRSPEDHGDAVATCSDSEEDAVATCSDNDGEEVKRPPMAPAVTIGSKLNPDLTGRSGRPVKVIPLKTFAATHSTRSRRSRRNRLMLERTREILRLKMRVHRLEAKCLHALGGPAVPQNGADPGVGCQPAAGEQKAAGGGGSRADSEGVPLTGAAPTSRDFGEEPLVVLRNERASKVPSVIKYLRENQLSDSMATFMPSDLQEALDVNHRLKVQLLNLQAVMLKWAMTNKKLRDDGPPKEAKEDGERSALGARLRQLLQLEAAVQAMFTPAQLRAIVLQHEDRCRDDLTEKRRKPLWGEEDLRRMLELRAISSDRVVAHVREKMKIPLPTLKTAKLRCDKSETVSEAYKEMLEKREEIRKHCDICESQLNTIDEVVDGTDDRPLEIRENSPFDSQYVRHVPQYSQDTVGTRPKKRRRTAVTATSDAQKKKRKKREAVTVFDGDFTSDSDFDLSDPDKSSDPDTDT